jgi:hypothetical protein
MIDNEVKLPLNRSEWPTSILQIFYKQYPFFVATDAQVVIDDTTVNSEIVTGNINFKFDAVNILVPFAIKDGNLLPMYVMYVQTPDGKTESAVITQKNVERLIINPMSIGLPVSNEVMKMIMARQSTPDTSENASFQNPLAALGEMGLYQPSFGKVKLAQITPLDKRNFKVEIYEK